MARALVTGGTGFLGLHLARALAHAGYEVRTLDIHPPGPGADPDWEFVEADVRDADAMAKAVRQMDVVVDNAALVPVTRSDPETYRSVNVDGCRTTLEAARKRDVYTLHISSSAIYGIPKELPILPTTPLAPFEPYGESKAVADTVVAEARRNGQTVASLRPRTLLGEGRLGIFDVIFARVRAGKRVPMFGAGHNKVQMSDVEDFCSAALRAIEKKANDDYNVGAETFGTVREDLQALIDHAGTAAKTMPVPTLAIRAVLQPLDAVGRSPVQRLALEVGARSRSTSISARRRPSSAGSLATPTPRRSSAPTTTTSPARRPAAPAPIAGRSRAGLPGCCAADAKPIVISVTTSCGGAATTSATARSSATIAS